MITLIQKPDHIADQGLVRKFEFLSYQNDENTLRKEMRYRHFNKLLNQVLRQH